MKQGKEAPIRIWIQSAAPSNDEPKWLPYRESLNRQIQEVKREDTSIEVHGVEFGTELMDQSSYVRFLTRGQIIENAIRAQHEGFDGFSVSNTLDIDLGYHEIRNVVDISVAFLAENCLHLACILADKFTVLCWNKALKSISDRTIRQYGLEQKFVPCDFFYDKKPKKKSDVV